MKSTLIYPKIPPNCVIYCVTIFLKKTLKKVLTFSRNAWYNVITVKEGGDKVIELITSIANLTSSLLALITAIIAYKLAKKE